MKVFFDVECYSNYFYVRFEAPRHIYTVRLFNDKLELGDRDIVARFIGKHTLVGFNSNAYDIPMIAAFLCGYSNAKLKKLSDQLINTRMHWEVMNNHPAVKIPAIDSVDLVGVTPLIASLKTYACRIHTGSLIDLPLPPDTVITRDVLELMETYCANDLTMTSDVLRACADDIRLRLDMGRQYSLDFRSKSGPQIAEMVLRQQLQEARVRVTRRPTKVKTFRYTMPGFIKFKTPKFRAVKTAVKSARFRVDKNGYAKLPDELNVAIEFAGRSYKMGIGGLHSQEKHQAVLSGGRHLGEWDVGSMYPSIILGQGLFPDHVGAEFCDVYRDIYDTRMAAKASGDRLVSDSLKLVLNSSFGKFGSQYSFLYSPELLVQTTITGQLMLMMLIERFTEAGIEVVSANTDGVVILHDGNDQAVVDDWQESTGLTLEWTPYQAIYSESVNNYIALYDGGAKLKGSYAPAGIGKGYQNEIVVDALVAYLANGVPLADTINGCDDIRKFLTMRGIRAGGVWEGQEIGRVARWYKSTAGHPIRYRSNGNKVAGSDDAVPMMKLGPMPGDLDRAWYVSRAEDLLKKLGVTQ